MFLLLNDLLCSSHGQWQAECQWRMLGLDLIGSALVRRFDQGLLLFVYLQ